MKPSAAIKADLLVIGRGLAGMAATVFAARHGLKVVQAGKPGQFNLCSGLFDLMNPSYSDSGRQAGKSPWKAIEDLVKKQPGHPYAKFSTGELEAAWQEMLGFFSSQGLPYFRRSGRNCRVMTPLGTLKSTYALPQSMIHGVEAREHKRPCLVVDFEGLRDFSAIAIRLALQDTWPGLRSLRLQLPGSGLGCGGQQVGSGEMLAMQLEDPEVQRGLGGQIKPHLRDAQSVGFPAVLGAYRHQEVMSALEEELGVPVFEIPTLPVSMPGLRLAACFERGLAGLGVDSLADQQVAEHDFSDMAGRIKLRLAQAGSMTELQINGVILASGRFLTGGLESLRTKVVETVFNLPVHQPSSRSQWHQGDFLGPVGHGINQAGVLTDNDLHPLDASGQPVHPGVFAVGSILAHQDQARMGCGAGVALGTAYRAVEQLAARLRPGTRQAAAQKVPA
jgi:glycerol-3-phosphate dehydrogenase subunit B